MKNETTTANATPPETGAKYDDDLDEILFKNFGRQPDKETTP